MKNSFKIIFSVSLIFSCDCTHAQQYKTAKEPLWIGLGTVFFSIGTVYYQRVPFPESSQLKPERVFSLDRFALRLHERGTGPVSNVTLAGSFCLPLYSISRMKSAKNRQSGLILLLESHLFSQGMAMLCKGIFQRPRPYAYGMSIPATNRMKRDAFRSFFSGHAAASFTNAMLAGCMVNAFHPPSEQTNWIWAGGFALATATGTFRVLSGNHFPTDVAVGAAVGCLAGYLIHASHR